ncbi:S-adenosyl-L-methionine-dependent methyltransferase [Tothia fuscella]|uniref:S-adenosyl-L-methionine-dependent methyltransferase n=1 Tax=Tothia fuscella TaxID=1048955 RepID=A0A9P4NS31_9PEZI|nr:S-adenosyl-L-methionine-dependent methyltransferase [Tothia fuscella]
MPPQEEKENTFTTGYNKSSLDRYTFRNVETCAAFLIPYLEFLRPDFSFLDIGCGPGSITTDLASRYPQASFTGIDPGKIFIDKAKDLARERGVEDNTNFLVGNLASIDQVLGTKVGTFDVVSCHQVLTHLVDPLANLKIMKAAARREGGIVAAREATTTIGDIFYPLLPGIEKWQKLQAEIVGAKTGGVAGFGPRLLETALHAGWARDKIKAGAGVWCYSDAAEKQMWVGSVVGMLENRDSEWYKKALEKGGTEEDMKIMAEAWREWEGRDEAWSTFMSAEIVCRNG